jgi:signal transducing adaptor molecule
MAILKRLNYRNSNVQLYALALAEALTKNCGVELHREIASRSFTQGLEKIVMDRVNKLFLCHAIALTEV